MAEQNEAKKPIYKKWWFWVIIILVIGIIGGSAGNTNNTITSGTVNNNKEMNEQPIEYIEIDIDELEEALKNNSAVAKDKYNGKYLSITGRLGTIDSDLKYISLLSTTDKFDLVGVHCTIKSEEQKESIKTLNRDDTIVVKGKITDVGEVLGYYLNITEISKK